MRLLLIIPIVTTLIFSFNVNAQSLRKSILTEDYEYALEIIEYKINTLKDKHKQGKKAFRLFMLQGQIVGSMGVYAKAEASFLKAYAILNDSEKPKAEYFNVLEDLANVYLHQGNFLLAEEIIEECIERRAMYFTKNNPIRYRGLLPQAKLYLHRGQDSLAYASLKKYQSMMMNSYRSTKNENYLIADSYRKLYLLSKSVNDEFQNKYAKRNYHLQKHRWTKSPIGRNYLREIESMVFLAEVQLQKGRYKKALRISDKAYALSQENLTAESPALIQLHLNRAHIFEQLSWMDLAYKFHQSAHMLQFNHIENNFSRLSTYEKERFSLVLKKNLNETYAFVVRCLEKDIQLPKKFLNDLFETRVRTKAIILNESNKMYEALMSSTDSVVIKKIDKWNYKKNLYALTVSQKGEPSKIRALTKEILIIEKELAAYSTLFDNSKSTFTIIDLQKELSENDKMIEIIRVKSNSKIHYLALKLGKEKQPSAHLLHLEKGFENRYFSYHRSCINYNIKDTNSFNVYLSPILNLLEGPISTLFVSSDGVYNKLNLGLIQSFTNVNDTIDIVNITNSKNIINVDQNMDINTALLIGRPSYYLHEQHDEFSSKIRSGVNDLPGTEKEIIGIKSSLTKSKIKTDVLLKLDATESNVKKAESANILHIATHGFFDHSKDMPNPMVSAGLLLTGIDDKSEDEDNILTAFEVSSLNLENTKVVILSACDTGLGAIEDGEGVYGLQRAFEVAGVRFVLMSMWKVDDEATQKLMTYLYSEFTLTNNIRLSFKRAREKLKLDFPQVKKWGAFKLIGF